MSRFPFSLLRFVFLFLLFFAVGAPQQGLAYKYPDKPPDEHFYVDLAGMIQPAEAQEIDKIAAQLLQEIKSEAETPFSPRPIGIGAGSGRVGLPRFRKHLHCAAGPGLSWPFFCHS